MFATLFVLMRIGLFFSMAAVAPLQALLRGVGVGLLANPTRLVLFLGGLVIVITGLVTLWSLRAVFGKPKLGAEARAILARTAAARRAISRRPRRSERTDSESDHERAP